MDDTRLYIVPTPIGNLGDITFRAVEILKTVDLILTEDTRKSGRLLKYYKINKPLKSYHNFNEHKILPGLIQQLGKGTKMALITDAGTPGISDPGFLLVRECLRNNLKLECLPGATAFIPAMIKSGLPTDSFIFEGFLPHKKGRKSRLEKLKEENRTIIIYESPHRLLKTLNDLIAFFGKDRQGSVSRELTKIHEETVNGSLEYLYKYYNKGKVKGEFVIIIEGSY